MWLSAKGSQLKAVKEHYKVAMTLVDPPQMVDWIAALQDQNFDLLASEG